jgi:hypothetical protein
MREHEYSLIGGVNRAQIGRYLGLAAASMSGAIVFILLGIVDLAKKFDLNANLPPSILSLVGASAVFAALYALFDRYIWRWPKLATLLKVPHLAGEWHCEGKSLAQDGQITHHWIAKVIITQTWDKFRVRLKTDQSGSNSITAALIYDEVDGYHLIYNYRNDPKIGQPELRSHVGFSNMIFSKDQTKAEGDYVNGNGRSTFGTMVWRRAE